ncbi:SusC/RagA family TonB-linked outer membrane protein [Arcticibacter tournemirensis]
MKKYLYAILLIFLMSPIISLAQTRVSGIVKDASGPLPGVSIKEKGVERSGTSTDVNGKFTMVLRGQANVLVFSSIGFQSQELKVQDGQKLEIILQASNRSLDEVVVVGFGKAKRITTTGSVSAIKGAEIREVPTSSVQNALQGKLPGFIAQQRSGQPGRDASDFFIRGVSSLNKAGNQPLIIVDDIEYSYEQLSQINVNEIESISILKDASTTAIYGIKGANGVLIVTTRRGTAGAPKINVRVETGLQAPVKKPTFLNSYESALLVNEALTNDGQSPQFSDEDLEHFRKGDDPYGHPDVNWYKEIFKPFSMQYNSNIDISGGAEAVKYFISGGGFTQNGNVRTFQDAENQVNPNYYYRRFNFRSNLDVQASKTLNLRFDLSGRFNRVNAPYAGNIVGEVYDFSRIHPYSAPFLNPNGSYAYASDTKGLLPTINARLATQGYKLERRNDLNVLFGGTQKLDALTEGLSFVGRVAYASVESNARLQRRENPPSYLYDPDSDTYTLNGPTYTSGNYLLSAEQGLFNHRVNIQAYLNYDRSFGSHNVHGMLLYNRESYKEKNLFVNADNWIPQNFKGTTFKAIYNYKEKYIVDFSAAYNGSDRFNANKRFGLFPAVSVGYSISKENFFRKKALEFIDLLKVRASYGVVGSDKVDGNRYLYDQVYLLRPGVSFGETDNSENSIIEGPLGNPDVTWEKQKEFDLGLDANLFGSKLNLTVDYFNNMRYRQLIKPSSLPLNIGVEASPKNIARVRNKGFDGELGYRSNAGNFSYNVSAVFSHFKNKILYMDEPSPAYPWLRQTGHSINQPFGYTFIGFDDKGNLKYKDFNEDGVIDESDKTAIGKPNLPSTSYGLTLGGRYKGFSINVLFQGTAGYSFVVKGTGIEPFQSQFQPIHQQRWTPENSQNAQFPRLTTNPTSINSPAAYLSDFWLIDAKYLRLKTLELGYQIPNKALPLGISNARIYLSGYNLLTWTNYSKYQQDPEVESNTAGDTYLNQRVINLGFQVGL